MLISSLADLTLYDLTQAKKFIDNSGISEEEFSRAEHWLVYRGISKCIGNNIPATPDNVVREISAINPQANALAISQIATSPDGDGSHLDGYCSKLLETSERRKSLKLLQDAAARIKRGDEPASSIKFKLSNSLLRTRGRQVTKSLNEYVKQAEQHLEDVRQGKVKPVIPCYMKKLDSALGGLQPTLILLGAQPGVGKSALMASLVDLQAKNGHKPFVASLEDGPSWLAYRSMSNDSGVNQFDLRFVKLSDAKYQQVLKSNRNADKYRDNIRIIDGSITGMRIEDLVSSANDAIVNEGCDSVWIDHLGEISLSNSERTDLEIARHLSLLRGVANKHGVPVVVAAHLKRPADPSLPPTFRDFANSSGAQRKARVALGLRRSPGSDCLSVHVMKQTNGPAGQIIDLNFNGAAAMIIESEGGFK